MSVGIKKPDAVVMTIGGVRYVYGLTWRFLPGLPGKAPADEASTMARSQKTPFGVILAAKPGARPIVGMTANRKARGAHAAGAIVSQFRKRSLVVLRLGPNQVWVCTGGAGQLDVDLDVIVDDRRAIDLIQKIVTEWSGKSIDFDTFASADHGLDSGWLEGLESRTAAQILASADPRAARLQTLILIPRLLLIAGVVAIALPASYTWKEYRDYSRQREEQRMALEAEARARQDAADFESNEALRIAAARSAVLQQLARDTATPAPGQSLADCRAAYATLGHYLGGWQVTTGRCDPLGIGITANLVLAYPSAPTFGTPASLTHAAQAIAASVSINTNLASASLTKPLPEQHPREAVTDTAGLPSWPSILDSLGGTLVSRARADTRFAYTLSDPTPLSITYVDPTALSADGSPVTKEVDPGEAYRSARLVLTASYLPTPVLDLLDQPHARLDSIDFLSGRISATYTLFVQP